MNENYTVENITKAGKAQKRNFGKLPKIKYFRVQSRGSVGTMDNRHDRKVGAWAVLVMVEGAQDLRLVTDVAYEFGMNVKGEYAEKQKAYDAAMEFKAKWGKATGAKAKRDIEREEAIRKNIEEDIRKNIIAELAKMTPEQRAKLISKAA